MKNSRPTARMIVGRLSGANRRLSISRRRRTLPRTSAIAAGTARADATIVAVAPRRTLFHSGEMNSGSLRTLSNQRTEKLCGGKVMKSPEVKAAITTTTMGATRNNAMMTI